MWTGRAYLESLLWVPCFGPDEEAVIFFFFDVDHFLKSLLNLLQFCSHFMFCFFGPDECGILASRAGIEPAAPALENKILTTGPPAKSQYFK